jgi:hypothetical protein
MVPSSTLTFSADGECLTCGGFFLSETIRLERFELIADYFGGLSLSPKRSNSSTAFMHSTHSWPPSPRRAMIEDYTEEFHMTSSRGGGSGIPSRMRLGTGASPAPVTTLPWQEDALTI